MARRKLQLAWMGNQNSRKASLKRRLNGLIKKTKELSILCNAQACGVFYDREEDKLVVWPSPEAAKSLLDNFYSLTDYERNKKAVDPESFIQTNIQKTEKRLVDTRKVIDELEMEHLMFQLQYGRQLANLSPTDVEKLITYSAKKITCLNKEMGLTEYVDQSVDEASFGWGGNDFNALENEWVFDVDPQVQKSCDETHFPATVTGLDLNMEPSDVAKYLGGGYKGESSKAAGGAEDDAE